MQHEEVARRILRKLGFSVFDPLIKIRAGGSVVQFRWDGVGRTSSGKLVLAEVEPANPEEDHIGFHVVKLALQAHFKKNVEKLIWIVDSISPNCHKMLKSYTAVWGRLLERLSREELPPMEYRDRRGVLISEEGIP